MRKTYSEFCSRHTKALKLYKELYARDKRFQQFIRVSKPLQDPHSASSSGPTLVDTSACGSHQQPLIAVEQVLLLLWSSQ